MPNRKTIFQKNKKNSTGFQEQKDSNNLRYILIVQTVAVVIAVIAASANYLTTENSLKKQFEIAMESKRKELETQLILNAFQQQDSTEQIKRLRNFCELNFFDSARKSIILNKIANGTIYTSPILNPVTAPHPGGGSVPSPGGNPSPSPGGNHGQSAGGNQGQGAGGKY